MSRAKDRIEALCETAYTRVSAADTPEQLRAAVAACVLEAVDGGRQLEQANALEPVGLLYAKVLRYAEAQRLDNARLRSIVADLQARIIDLHCAAMRNAGGK